MTPIRLAIGRRVLLGAGAAAVLSNAAQALRAGGLMLDFEAVGGSVRNSGERNRLVFVAALGRLGAAGGGTLRIAAKTFRFPAKHLCGQAM